MAKGPPRRGHRSRDNASADMPGLNDLPVSEPSFEKCFRCNPIGNSCTHGVPSLQKDSTFCAKRMPPPKSGASVDHDRPSTPSKAQLIMHTETISCAISCSDAARRVLKVLFLPDCPADFRMLSFIIGQRFSSYLVRCGALLRHGRPAGQKNALHCRSPSLRVFPRSRHHAQWAETNQKRS